MKIPKSSKKLAARKSRMKAEPLSNLTLTGQLLKTATMTSSSLNMLSPWVEMIINLSSILKWDSPLQILLQANPTVTWNFYLHTMTMRDASFQIILR